MISANSRESNRKPAPSRHRWCDSPVSNYPSVLGRARFWLVRTQKSAVGTLRPSQGLDVDKQGNPTLKNGNRSRWGSPTFGGTSRIDDPASVDARDFGVVGVSVDNDIAVGEPGSQPLVSAMALSTVMHHANP